jgi:hypothetical protein
MCGKIFLVLIITFKFAFIFYTYELEYNNSGLKLDQTYTLGISCLSDFQFHRFSEYRFDTITEEIPRVDNLGDIRTEYSEVVILLY